MQGADRRVLIETARYRIFGSLRLPLEGHRSRLTEYLNTSERAFLPLTGVTIQSLDGSHAERHDFAAVSTSHAVMVVPIDAED